MDFWKILSSNFMVLKFYDDSKRFLYQENKMERSILKQPIVLFLIFTLSIILCHSLPVMAQTSQKIEAQSTVPGTDRLINFQGQLTDSKGSLLNGTYTVTFRIYPTANGGGQLWDETYKDLKIQNGHFSILLGSIRKLNTVSFDESKYLGIQIGTEGELVPRQMLIPAFHANSASVLTVTYKDGSKGNVSPNEILPVGSIIPFYGNYYTLPENWRMCDGSLIKDTQSPFHGLNLPDLRGRFVMGATETTMGDKANVCVYTDEPSPRCDEGTPLNHTYLYYIIKIK
jgi:hypothetical protein